MYVQRVHVAQRVKSSQRVGQVHVCSEHLCNAVTQATAAVTAAAGAVRYYCAAVDAPINCDIQQSNSCCSLLHRQLPVHCKYSLYHMRLQKAAREVGRIKRKRR